MFLIFVVIICYNNIKNAGYEAEYLPYRSSFRNIGFCFL